MSAAKLALDPAGLRYNGGPTQTIALEPQGTAIDSVPQASCTYAGPNPGPTTGTMLDQLTGDQRGEPRPDLADGVNGNCNIGAYEFQSPPPVIDCSNAAASLLNLIALPPGVLA